MIIDRLSAADCCLAEVDVRPSIAQCDTGNLALATKVSNDVQIIIEIGVRTGGKERTKSVESRFGGHSCSGIGTGSKAIGLIRSEKKKPSPLDWSAERKPESVFDGYRLARAVGPLACSQCIERAVVEYIISGTVKLIRSTPGDDVDYGTTGAAEFRGVVRL